MAAPEIDDVEMVPIPTSGRVFTMARRVGLGDVDPHGRARLDSIARYLQDIATADADDAALGGTFAWVVRRTTIVPTVSWPSLGERLTLTTFCGGVGSRWAERRTSVVGDRGSAFEAVALWVAIDTVTGRPTRLSERFHEVFAPAAGGRQVRARLEHDNPDLELLASAATWAIRFSDLDTLGHVNNAAHWCVAEEVLAGRVPGRVQIEFRDALDGPGESQLATTSDDDGSVRLWLLQDRKVRTSIVIETASDHFALDSS